jgi:hypothetical protein
VSIAASDATAPAFWYSRGMADEKRATMLLKLRNMASGRLEINAGHVRRGIQFLVNIGTLLVALRGECKPRSPPSWSALPGGSFGDY